MKRDAGYWIDALQLSRHPEGGYFVQIYKSTETIPAECLPDRFPRSRAFSTAIFYLLTSEECSALHRIRSDELWHFYAGSPLSLYVIDPTGRLSKMKLGSDLERGEAFQCVVPAGCWFGAMVEDSAAYSLVGCTVAPGFEYEDLEMGDRRILLESYPEYRSIIEKLTR